LAAGNHHSIGFSSSLKLDFWAGIPKTSQKGTGFFFFKIKNMLNKCFLALKANSFFNENVRTIDRRAGG